MTERASASRRLMYAWVYALPFPLVAGMYVAWFAWSGSRAFALYVLALPVFFGYAVPGIASNVMHRWRFRGPWVMGGIYAHHGIKYASTMTPLLFLAFLGTPHVAPPVATVARVLLCTAMLHGYVQWLHDVLLVRHGMVEFRDIPPDDRRAAQEHVTHYAPACFFTIGLTYAASALLAFRAMVVAGDASVGTFLLHFLIGVALMTVIPTIVYHFLEGTKQ